jgi:hypothetical protein
VSVTALSLPMHKAFGAIRGVATHTGDLSCSGLRVSCQGPRSVLCTTVNEVMLGFIDQPKLQHLKAFVSIGMVLCAVHTNPLNSVTMAAKAIS